MLTGIHVRDFAIVEQLELELRPGMTVLTGETGAGKSILIDALGLALGDRADSGIVRHGAERAEVAVRFDIADRPAVRTWLAQHDLDADGECLLRRVVSSDGRSKGYLNGQPVPLQSLKEVGEMLVDIHGQHEHQSLVRRDIQRQLLDDYAGNGALLEALQTAFRAWRERSEELETLQRATDQRTERLELLRYQVRELDTLALGEHEVAELDQEHTRLANAGKLLETCQRALAALYENDEGAAHSLIGHSLHEIESLCALDAELVPVRDLLNSALIQVQEGAEELRRYGDRLDLDPQRLEWVEERLGTIHDLARKHRVLPQELTQVHEALRAELDTLDHADARLGGLQREVDALTREYRSKAATLREQRVRAARSLGDAVSAIMRELGMPGGRFEIEVADVAPERFTLHGLDTIEFLVSANPGQPVQPLAKVASGGELSRISLAIQVVAAHGGRIPTLIFDEVDTGIGGGVAEIVGRRLRALGTDRQVLCVTHLPQVAAQAHHHLQVSKDVSAGRTRTSIAELGDAERLDEVARMLGGVEITEQTRAHAREMLERASKPGKAGGESRRGRTVAKKAASSD